jgi:hypothetical protein
VKCKDAEMQNADHFGSNQANENLQWTVGLRRPDECENITQQGIKPYAPNGKEP